MDDNQGVKNATLLVQTQNNTQSITAVTDSLGKFVLTIPAQWLEGEYNITITNNDYYSVKGVVLIKDGQERTFFMKRKTIKTPDIKEAKKTDKEIFPTGNLVFLIDVSSSMNTDGKIDMLKVALKHLTSLLRPTDKVSIVTYSTTASIHMNTTYGDEKEKIYHAIDNLVCAGITMGGLGLDLAYKVAKKKYLKDENNKVILVTDGAFTSTSTKKNKSMDKLIEKMHSEHIALSVFSFGNIRPKTKDNLERLSQLGGGHYAHIDSEEEAKREMVHEAKSFGVFKK